MIDNFFYGQLFYTTYGWQFASNKNHCQNMVDFFSSFVSAWLNADEIVSDNEKKIRKVSVVMKSFYASLKMKNCENVHCRNSIKWPH